jgi:predicted DNA-binding transcriptional regulator AlpA
MQTQTNALPTSGLVRLRQVLAVLPISRSTWWRGISEGRFPRAIKLGPNTSAWRVEDIRALLDHGIAEPKAKAPAEQAAQPA